jgi:hypothetical protein
MDNRHADVAMRLPAQGSPTERSNVFGEQSVRSSHFFTIGREVPQHAISIVADMIRAAMANGLFLGMVASVLLAAAVFAGGGFAL